LDKAVAGFRKVGDGIKPASATVITANESMFPFWRNQNHPIFAFIPSISAPKKDFVNDRPAIELQILKSPWRWRYCVK
jgi:hypothetical protein